jgi:chromosomal replication initiator protein
MAAAARQEIGGMNEVRFEASAGERGPGGAASWAAGAARGAKHENGDRGEIAGMDAGELEQAWHRITSRLKAELGEDVFGSWFVRVAPERVVDGAVFLSVPTKFLKSWISEHYRARLVAHWRRELEGIEAVELTVRVPRAAAAERPQAPACVGAEREPVQRSTAMVRAEPAAAALADEDGGLGVASPLDPRFTFDTYLVGHSNGVAHAAARQVAAGEGTPQFNPLYLHASVGRGKTHLLQAIAAGLAANGRRRVLYLTAERFMYRFVAALRSNSALSFKDLVRGIDVLLIDDMQFLQGRSIQEEFCHTLNALIDASHQVVVAADRPPAELGGLDERVRSRLAGGLVIEVGAPERDLRVSILKTRANAARERYPAFDMSPAVIEHLAEQVTTNGRDLDGIFNRILAHNQFGGTAVTVELAERTVRELLRGAEPKKPRIEDIQRMVAKHFNVSKADLLSNRRTRSIVRPRQIAMYMAKMMTPRSLPEIGRRFGGRDHTTVLHAVRKVESLMAEDPTLAQDIEILMRQLEE